MDNTLYTLVLPSGDEGNQILVLTDVVVLNGKAYPVFEDITYSHPIYLSYLHLVDLFSYPEHYNLWTIDDIDRLKKSLD